MRKHRKLLIALASLAVIGGVVVFASRDNEPHYKGKSLSEWLHLWADALPGDPSRPQAEAAIHAMGTNAVRCFLSWMHQEPTYKPSRIGAIILKIPVLKNNERLHNRINGFQNTQRDLDTRRVFEILRPYADIAIPTLTAYLNDTNYPITAMNAAVALTDLGDMGYLPLWQALAEPRHFARQGILCALFWTPPSSTNATIAVQLIVRHTEDPDLRVAETALAALGAIATNAETAFPALANALNSKNAQLRSAAVGSIGRFGTNALELMPALRLALADQSPQVQSEATNALLQIAPELLTNAPAK